MKVSWLKSWGIPYLIGTAHAGIWYGGYKGYIFQRIEINKNKLISKRCILNMDNNTEYFCFDDKEKKYMKLKKNGELIYTDDIPDSKQNNIQLVRTKRIISSSIEHAILIPFLPIELINLVWQIL